MMLKIRNFIFTTVFLFLCVVNAGSLLNRMFAPSEDAIVYERQSGFGITIGGRRGVKVKASLKDEVSLSYPVFSKVSGKSVGVLTNKSSFEIKANSTKSSSEATVRVYFPQVESQGIKVSRVGYINFQKTDSESKINLLNLNLNADYFICVGQNPIGFNTKTLKVKNLESFDVHKNVNVRTTMSINTVKAANSPSVILDSEVLVDNRDQHANQHFINNNFFSEVLNQANSESIKFNIRTDIFDYQAPSFLAVFALTTPVANVSDTIDTTLIPYNGCSDEVQRVLNLYTDKQLQNNPSLLRLRNENTRLQINNSKEYLEVKIKGE